MRSHPSCRHRGRGQLSFRRNRRQQRKRQSRAHRRALFETLEPRHLLAADTVARLEAAIVSQTDGSQWLDTAGVDLATANSVIAAASSPSQPLLVNDLSDLDDNLLGLNGEPGSLSLREAIRLANADIAPDTIMFDPALFATPQTITLGDTDGDGAADVTGTELLITSELSITGPGAEQLSIDAQGASRVLHNTGVAILSGLKITGGNAVVGGGLYNDAGRLTLIAVDVSGNEATYGGGIYNSLASLSLSQSAIHDNTAVVQGGGIDSGDASLDIFQTAIYGNTTTTHDGGGIHFGDGRLTISQSTLFDNSAARDGGGSYFSDGTFQLSASTVYDNSAGRDGGGLFTPAGGVDIFQSTLSGNTAVGAGGGLASESNSKLVNVTVTDNRAGSGGGLWVRQSGLLLNNTIVAGNAQLDGASHNDLQVAGTTPIDADSRHNLFGWGGSGNLAHDPGGTGNLVGFDPLLAELGHYGGPTPTHELLAGSPAIDAGEVFYALHPDGQSLVTDQRGSEFPRLVSQLLDIGAVEQRIAVSLESGEMLRIDDRSSHLNRIVLAATTTAEGNRVTINGAPIPLAADVVQGLEIFGGDGNDLIDLSRVGPGTFPSLLEHAITIYAGSGDDEILGSPFADILVGEAGHDRLHGGFGDDTYQFSGSADLGVDSLFELAGEGADTLDFSGLDFGAGIAVNLSLGETGQQVIDHGGRQLALLPSDAANFENLVGTAYGDLLTGNQFANEIHGLAGNDKIFGGAGDDLLDGGPNHFEIGGERETLDGEGGSDTYLAVPGAAWTEFIESSGDDRYVFAAETQAAGFGNIDILPGVASGRDTLDFSRLPSRAIFSLTETSRQAVTPEGGLLNLLAAGANIENLVGTPFDDSLTGSAGANRIEGGEGNDILSGEAGNDQLLGGDGEDTLFGGAGSDDLDAGPNTAVDVVYGGGDDDIYRASPGATVTLFLEQDGDDTYVFAGDALGEVRLRLQGGNNDGTDLFDFSGLTTRVVVALELSNGQLQEVTPDTQDLTLKLENSSWGPVQIENIIGTQFNDSLTGNQVANRLEGRGGDDVLFGRSGNDVLDGGSNTNVDHVYGESGHDSHLASAGSQATIFYDDSGNDEYLFGNAAEGIVLITQAAAGVAAGIDTLDFRGMDSGVSIDLGADQLQEVAAASSTLQIALANNSSTAGPVDIENVIGSHFDDHITGNSLNNHLLGEDGRDRLETGGNSGSTPEILDGGQGDDTLVVSPGSVATQLLETMGSDTFVFAAGNLGTVTIDAQFVTENQGTDTLDFSAVDSRVVVALDDASPQQVAPDTGNLQLELKYVEIGPNPQRLIPVRIENVVGSSYDDELVGSEFANQIRGGAGNDIIRGGEGDDELSGEGGNDRLEGQAGHDRLLGGDDDDLLQGGAGNDWLDGGSGNLSTLAGGDNDDHYVVSEVSATTVAIAEHAGGGVDTLWLSQSTGPQGAVADLDQVAAAPVFAGVTLDLATQAQGQIENIVGTQYADTLFGSSADNLISGLGGDDFLSGRDGNDTLSGGSGRDRILGGNHDDYLSGGADDDELFGEANDDFLNGGDGDDTLVAGTGGDALDPGPGNDTLDETSLPIIDFAAGLEAAEVLLGSILYTVPSVAAFVSQQGVTPQNKIHHTIANLIGPAKTVDIAITVPGQPTFSKTITVIGAEVDQQILTALNESGFFAPGDFAVSTIGPINFQETTVVEFTGAYAETEVSLDVQGGTTPGQQVYTIVAQPAAQGVDERALLTADAAVVNGFFHLSYGGVVSAAIPTDASAAELAAAIEAIASRAVSVSKTAAAQWEVTFARFAAADLVPRAAGPDVQISWGDGSAVAAATLTPAGPFSLGSSQQVDIFGTHTYSLSGGTIIKVAVSGASQHGVAHPTLKLGARIAAVDTDADGLTDDIELDIGSDPHNPDTDGDRLPDKFEFDSELLNPTGPDAPDVDGDGLTNRQEFEIGTDPDLPDTDHDGLTDLQESDLDGDGLIYQEEIDLETDPNRFDTDGDLLSDGFEVNSTTLDPRTADDLEGDHDADGLSNFLEQIFGTDPDDPDSDGDQVSDGDEIAQGSDPHLDSDFAAPDDSQLVGLQLTVGDFSGSHSERYDLAVGALLHQAPQFGVVVTNLYEAFRSGRTYSIRLFHRGSNLSSPDYDYIADVALPAESAGLIVIEDPEQILGTHYDRDTFFAQSSNPRVAYFHTPLVDLDITRPTVVDQREATSGVRVAVNDDDDDGDGRSDDIDAVILGENDVVTLTLRSLLPVALHAFLGEVRLRFPADKIRLWEDPNYHPADPLSTLSKTNPILSDFLVNDFTIDHTYYVEGLEVGVAEIDATYQVYDQPGLRTEGVVEITDTVKVTVVDRVGSVDIQIDDLGENLEQSPGAIIWRNSDFSNQIPAPNDPQEPGLPLYVPDYQAGLQGFPDELDPNYQADFTRGKVTIDPPFLMDHDLRFTFAADDIEIWTRSAWNDFESVGQGWYKVSEGIEITPEATSFEFWIEGINNSTAFAADSVRVEVVPRDLPSLLPSATDEAFYTVVETNFAVDGNRDAQIDFQSSHDRQLLFWYNIDREGLNPDGHDNTLFDNLIEAEALGFTGPIDFVGGSISQSRDLEDFSHLQIQVDPLVAANTVNSASENSPSSGQLQVTYSLALENTGGSGLNLFKTASEQVLDHLSSLLRAQEQIANDDLSAALAYLGDAELENIEAGINAFLFEANGSGVAHPTLVFTTTIKYTDDSTTAKRHTISLELREFADFYSRYEVDYGQNDFGGADQRQNLNFQHFPTPSSAHDSQVVDKPFVGKHPADTEPDHIILVHGWNHTAASKRAYAETAFKRLYWQGFRGHFVQFDWPTFADSEGPLDVEATSLRDGANLTYNPSEFQAYRSGQALREVIAGLDGKKHLLAHSMGNVVAAEALRQSTDELVDTYTAMEAAISAGAYGSDRTDAFDITLRDPDSASTMSLFTATWQRDIYGFSNNDLLRHWPGHQPTSNDYYLSGKSGAAGRWINIFNPSDSATNTAWRTNNLLKVWVNVSDPGHPGPPGLAGPDKFYVAIWSNGFGLNFGDSADPENNMHWLFSPNSIWPYRYVHDLTDRATYSRVYKEYDRSQHPNTESPADSQTPGWTSHSTIAVEDYWFHTDTNSWADLTESLLSEANPGATGYEILAFISQSNGATLGTGAFPFSFSSIANTVSVNLSELGLAASNANNPANHSFQFNHDSATTWKFWERIKEETGFRSTRGVALSSQLASSIADGFLISGDAEPLAMASSIDPDVLARSFGSFATSLSAYAWPPSFSVNMMYLDPLDIAFKAAILTENTHELVLSTHSNSYNSLNLNKFNYESSKALATDARATEDTREAIESAIFSIRDNDLWRFLW